MTFQDHLICSSSLKPSPHTAEGQCYINRAFQLCMSSSAGKWFMKPFSSWQKACIHGVYPWELSLQGRLRITTVYRGIMLLYVLVFCWYACVVCKFGWSVAVYGYVKKYVAWLCIHILVSFYIVAYCSEDMMPVNLYCEYMGIWSCDSHVTHVILTACPFAVVLGDTCDNALIAPLCLKADVLVHEATNEDEMQASAVDNGHSTPGEAYMISEVW